MAKANRPFIGRGARRGFSYVGLLILVAVLGVAMAATGDFWQIASRREKEIQLLFVGDQFRRAIKRYRQQPGTARHYPSSLDDLLLDPRFPNPHRYLRRIYVDPITGTADWGLVRGPSGEIYGVYSRSEEQPIKQANFRVADASFEGRTKYSEWQFVDLGGQRQLVAAPAAVPPTQLRPGPVTRPSPVTRRP